MTWVAGFEIQVDQWQDVQVVVVRGDLDVEAATSLGRQLARLQRESTVYVDLWDVSDMDPIAISVLAAAKQRTKAVRWEFAVIAPPGGLAAEEIEAAGMEAEIATFATKHDAQAALRKA